MPQPPVAKKPCCDSANRKAAETTIPFSMQKKEQTIESNTPQDTSSTNEISSANEMGSMQKKEQTIESNAPQDASSTNGISSTSEMGSTSVEILSPREAFNLLLSDSIVVLDGRKEPGSLYPGSVPLSVTEETLQQCICASYKQCVDEYGPENPKTVLFFVPGGGVTRNGRRTSLSDFGEEACISLKKSGVVRVTLVEVESFVDKFGFLLIGGNFDIYPNEITDTLYLGSKASLTHIDKLGITAVLTLTERPVEVPECVEAHKHFHIADSLSADMASALEECCPWLKEQIFQGRKVLVHCEQGMSRSACVVVAYLCEATGEKWYNVLAEVKNCRPLARPNGHFIKILEQRYAPR